MSQGSPSAPQLGLIGCGAIAEAFHLPALARRGEVMSRLVVVDPDVARARVTADRYGATEVVADHREVLDRLDGALVAVPRHLHHRIALDCVRAGVPVLCEKPLCETAGEARELLEAADTAGVAVAVNQTRRLFPAAQEVQQLIAAGAIGGLRRLDYALGEEFDWPAATDSYFGAKGSRRGILLDIGAHIVDLACWWLGARPELVDYRDDSFGGTEAVCDVQLRHADCSVHLRLSWLGRLANVYRIEGETGAISGEAYEWSSLALESGGRSRRIRTSVRPGSFGELAFGLIDNFIDVVRDGAQPLVPGAAVLPSLEIIDACYARRARFDMPWQDAHQRLAS